MGDSIDAVISIDFGMTATGVAYSVPPYETTSQMNWAEEAGKNKPCRGCTKIPTVLKYDGYSSPRGGRLIAWGFEATQNSETLAERRNFKIVEWFKPYLNSAYLKTACKSSATFLPKSDSEVRRWYIDYLRKLYDKVRAEISRSLNALSLEMKHIEFRFTWPTTWTAADIESFRECIVEAGFQDGGSSHRVILSYSEAQAAALYVAGQLAEKVKDGDTVMVCDVGGATTDIAVVKAVTDAQNLIRFDLDWSCQGKPIGGTDIDAAFQMFVEQRLSLVPGLHSYIPQISRDLREGRKWHDIKSYGYGNRSSFFEIPIDVPANEAARIDNGKLEITSEELQDIFQESLARVQRAVLDAIQSYGQPLNHLVGCGGYFHIEVARNSFKEILLHPALYLNHCSKTKIEITEKPELAVSKGGCLCVPHRGGFEKLSFGIVCGEQVYELAGKSKLPWIDDSLETRSGSDAAGLLETGAKIPTTFNVRFKRYPQHGYYYLTIVVWEPKHSLGHPVDADGGKMKPLCQLRIRKRHIASKWSFLGGEPKMLSLDWNTSGGGIYLDIYHERVRSKIPFELREGDIRPFVKVHVLPGTKRISKTQWK